MKSMFGGCLALAVTMACANARAATTIAGVFISTAGTVGAHSSGPTPVLTIEYGYQFDVNFKRSVSESAFCAPTITGNFNQYAVGSAKVVSNSPLVVDVILFNNQATGEGPGTGFYLTVACF